MESVQMIVKNVIRIIKHMRMNIGAQKYVMMGNISIRKKVYVKSVLHLARNVTHSTMTRVWSASASF